MQSDLISYQSTICRIESIVYSDTAAAIGIYDGRYCCCYPILLLVYFDIVYSDTAARMLYSDTAARIFRYCCCCCTPLEGGEGTLWGERVCPPTSTPLDHIRALPSPAAAFAALAALVSLPQLFALRVDSILGAGIVRVVGHEWLLLVSVGTGTPARVCYIL